MRLAIRIILAALLFIGAALSLFWFLQGRTIEVLEPKGLIALKQKQLILTSFFLMLIVVIPVFILTIGIAWKYRASNHKAKHTPDWDHNLMAECIWWGIPSLIILALAIITWKSSHALDPYKPLTHVEGKPIRIQVVALTWKWLFIYPEEGVASVNFMQVPVHRPINFEITSDAPMNSFWIPQLGGQIYAMSGMTSKLHLIAEEEGEYRGQSANISGEGFAGMTFIAKASSEEEYDEWLATAKKSPETLDLQSYTELAKPSKYNPVALYALKDPELFHEILMKYMAPRR